MYEEHFAVMFCVKEATGIDDPSEETTHKVQAIKVLEVQMASDTNGNIRFFHRQRSVGGDDDMQHISDAVLVLRLDSFE